MQEVPEHEVLKTPPERADPVTVSTANGYTTPPHTPPGNMNIRQSPEADDEPYDDVQIIEQQPVVHSVQTVKPATSQVLSKARLVTVPKRLPPKLPPRNPGRNTQVVVEPPARSRTPSLTGSILSGAPDAGAKPIDIESTAPGDDTAASKANDAGLQSTGVPVDASPAPSETDAAAAKLEDVDLRDLKDQDGHKSERSNSLRSVEQGRQQEHTTLGASEKMPGGFD